MAGVEGTLKIPDGAAIIPPRGGTGTAPPRTSGPLMVGSVVKLKSGGGAMAIVQLLEIDDRGHGAVCAWHDNGGMPQQAWYPLACLGVY